MKILLLILSVLSSSAKYIKYYDKFVNIDKNLELGYKKQIFTFDNENILVNGESLCTDGKEVIFCKGKKTKKWVAKLMGNKYKIFTKKWRFGQKKCWEIDGNRIKLHKCKDKISQLFDIIDSDKEECNNGFLETENCLNHNNNESYDKSSESNEMTDEGDLDLNKLLNMNEHNDKGLESNCCDFENKTRNELTNNFNLRDRFNNGYNCNANNKMERAYQYIQENYANYQEVMNFYKNIERHLNCN